MTTLEAYEMLANSEASGISHDEIYGPGSHDACCRVLAGEFMRHPRGALVPDLSMLVRRLCNQLSTHNTVAKQAMAFLKKHELQGSPLR